METLICLDTEFSDFPPEMELLSLGLAEVAGDRTFYVECDDIPEHGIGLSFFVQEHVLPHMTGPRARRDRIGQMLAKWLEQFHQPIVIVTDAPEFDWWLMREVMGDRAHALKLRPHRFDSVTMGPDWVEVLLAARASVFDDEHFEHHALHDALALRAMVLKGLAAGWRPAPW
jgi:hypothetical protein